MSETLSDTPAGQTIPDGFRPPARNSKLTAAFLRKVYTAIAMGLYHEQAARFGGVHPDTFSDWLTQGRRDREKIEDYEERGGSYAEETPFSVLLQQVEAAELDSEYFALASVQSKIATDGRLALEYLARKFPERWGRKDRNQPAPASNFIENLSLLFQTPAALPSGESGMVWDIPSLPPEPLAPYVNPATSHHADTPARQSVPRVAQIVCSEATLELDAS